MAFTLTIETDNAAFEPNPHFEVARLLRQVADDVESTRRVDDGQTVRLVLDSDGTARDLNGNTVARWSLS